MVKQPSELEKQTFFAGGFATTFESRHTERFFIVLFIRQIFSLCQPKKARFSCLLKTQDENSGSRTFVAIG
jgi:hypothetical protein